MPLNLPASLRDFGRRRINRTSSPALAMTLPWLLIMLGSSVPSWPVIASAPVMPPLGYLFLIAWCQLRPGLMPVWAGFPLGMFDDLLSGQPFGSAVLLWSATVIALDVLEMRFPWRGILYDWAIAAGLITLYLLLSLGFANLAGGATPAMVLAPQWLVSMLLFPFAAWLTGRVDILRLLPIRTL